MICYIELMFSFNFFSILNVENSHKTDFETTRILLCILSEAPTYNTHVFVDFIGNSSVFGGSLCP